jgi:hypothetical protein
MKDEAPSKFKSLFTALIAAKGDWGAVKHADKKKDLKVLVWESFPNFLATDGHNYVPVHFTADAVKDAHKKHSNLKISDLKDKVIHLTSWDLEMVKVNSTENFTSYHDVEVRVVVNSFKPAFNEKFQLWKYVRNIFRDDEVKTHVLRHCHSVLQETCKSSELPSVQAVERKGGKASVGKSGPSTSPCADFASSKGTKVQDMKDLFVQEKGEAEYKKWKSARSVEKKDGGEKAQEAIKSAVTRMLKKKTPGKASASRVTPGKAKKPQLKMAAYQNYLAKFGRN